MRTRDFVHLSLSSVLAQRMRSVLTALGIAVGIAAVVLLTSIGEGVRQFVLHEFSQFGTNLIAVNPGRTTTHGMPSGAIASVRPLSLGDAEALARLPHVEAMVPGVQGNAQVSAGGRSRRTTVFGAGPQLLQVWNARLALGRSLPADNPRTARAFAVLGSKLRSELFGTRNPLGARLRIGGETFRVIGALAPQGQVLGFDLDDTVYIPAGRAMALFDREGLMEIDVRYAADVPASLMAERIRKVLMQRHGSEDFTITTQEDMLSTLGNILSVLTLAVGALGGISLLVGAVGIFTIMNIG
ncbi:MAG: ABC transporter permease, partial [Acidihalobacter sp.]